MSFVCSSVELRLPRTTSRLLDYLDSIEEIVQLSLLDLEACLVTFCDRDPEGSLVQSLIKETKS